MPGRSAIASFALLVACAVASAPHAQPAVTASSGWIEPPADGAAEARAFVVVENSTMYDVYVVGARTEVAGAVELEQAAEGGGQAATVTEVPVPAYGQLEMSPEGVYLVLRDLTRPLKAGETVSLVVLTDRGEELSVPARVGKQPPGGW